ncbi:MAG: EAL domain-containing protein [Methylococcales bacterium]
MQYAQALFATVSHELIISERYQKRIKELQKHQSELNIDNPTLRNALQFILEAEEKLLQREESLLKRQQKFETIHNHLPAMIAYWDKNQINCFANKAYEEWFGITPETMAGMHLCELLGERLYNLNLPYIQAALAGERQFFERLLTDASGVARFVQAHYIPDMADGQVNGFFVLITDITELKHSQQKLFKSESSLRAMYENLPFLAWMKDCQGNFVYANQAWKNTAGLTPDDNVAGKNDFDFWPEKLAEHYRSTDQEVQLKRQQKRLIEKSLNLGNEHWAETFKSPVIDENGQLIGTVGLSRDITADKIAEEKLKLAASIYECSSEAMLVTDAENLIIGINPAFTQITGYTLDEVLGKNPKIFSSGKHNKDFYQAMWDSIIKNHFWQGEMCDKKKDGELHTKKMTINVITDSNGKIDRYICQFSDISDVKKNEALIWHQANYDALTNLPNRRLFIDRLEQKIYIAERMNSSLAVLLIDLDRFKEINDTLGHQVGDYLLVEVAKRITNCVSASDTVSRLGGDEFMIILSELNGHFHAETIAEKILASLNQPLKLNNELIYTSCSIGISMYPNNGNTTDDLIKNADQAMYQSKQSGRNCFSFFTGDMQKSALERLRLSAELHSALTEMQFCLFYQPIVEIATGKIHKAEALIRWRHPIRGLISPAEFIPIAEETGLIVKMGDWIFKEACHFAKHISNVSQQAFQISINKSPLQFREQQKSEDWANYLKELELDPKQIVVEITEGLLLNSDAGVKNRLMQFRDAGIEVAIDDFGTGYSSLSYLYTFDIDYLKIDQSFTRNLRLGSPEMAISEAIILMAHKLGLKVIAEGVETKAQLDLLTAAGCDFVQGYYFSKPLPADEFVALIKNVA